MNIAIVGASTNKWKYGNRAIRAYLSKGHKVFPVNPHENEIEGLKCYKSLSEIKEKIDVVSMYVPPQIGIKVADEIIKLKIKKVYLNPGSESDELIKKLKDNSIEPLLECSILAIGLKPDDLV